MLRTTRWKLEKSFRFWLHMMLVCAVVSSITARLMLAFDLNKLACSFIGYVASLGGGICLVLVVFYYIRLYQYDR